MRAVIFILLAVAATAEYVRFNDTYSILFTRNSTRKSLFLICDTYPPCPPEVEYLWCVNAGWPSSLNLKCITHHPPKGYILESTRVQYDVVNNTKDAYASDSLKVFYRLDKDDDFRSNRAQIIGDALGLPAERIKLRQGIGEKGLIEGTPEFETALKEFDDRMAHYLKHRLYPVLPDWPVICFYPMSKRRSGDDNWYSLSYGQRRELMSGHARVGRTYSGRILQLITGSTGLDEYEWGVTLLAKDTIDIKSIVYEMRFDEVTTRFGEFGDFLISLQLPVEDIFRRLGV